MGYYTRYEISVTNADGKQEEIIDDVKSRSGYTDLFDESCKWYDHEETCKSVSKDYPSAVIELYGEGEESGDIWKKYFKNGKMQVCNAKVVISDFNESQLK